MPRRKMPVPPEPERVAANLGNDLAAALSRLIQDGEPANRAEAFLLIRWQKLTRDQKKALAAKWNLPVEQKADEWLARQAIQELGDISLTAAPQPQLELE